MRQLLLQVYNEESCKTSGEPKVYMELQLESNYVNSPLFMYIVIILNRKKYFRYLAMDKLEHCTSNVLLNNLGI